MTITSKTPRKPEKVTNGELEVPEAELSSQAQPSPPKRSVSFGPASSAPANEFNMSSGAGLGATTSNGLGGSSTTGIGAGPSAPATPARGSSIAGSNESSASTPSSALKPALKASAQGRKLPPAEQYSHPDPLLRRLRLLDEHGKPINLKSFFKGAKVVGFYFSSQWAGQPLKEYHKTISEFCRNHPNDFKCIYVSVDVDEQWYKAGVKGKPWVSMAWNDGSSLPSERADTTASATAPSSPVFHNNEDYLLAGEVDIDESLSRTDTDGTAYLRPFSRVHLASKLNIIAAPTLCVYHIDKGKMLDWNVRMARIKPGSDAETWERWVKGEPAKSFGFQDAFYAAPASFIMCGVAIVLWLVVFFFGQDYNVLRYAINALDGSIAKSRTGLQDVSASAFDAAAEARKAGGL
ncbi:Thioredoxin-like fold [Ceraceosorus bombacis]|uniref:Thioredoxin-like fold n=1 Tax=Ceraceosorus bombacis TaxID=401625 RepID=A0A0P1BDP0_9BASI|nr:Thioredoxin-like fold [Ceraceosorus bombacis]